MKESVLVCVLIISISTSGCFEDENPGRDYGPYDIIIDRAYYNETERDLIIFCENTPPEYNHWWNETFDFVRIPLVVWNESIQYYVGLVEDFRVNRSYEGFNIYQGKVEYKASVEYFHNDGQFNTSEKLLIKVHLSLYFSETCGYTCGCRFNHYRDVVLTEDLEIIEIVGDYIQPGVMVS